MNPLLAQKMSEMVGSRAQWWTTGRRRATSERTLEVVVGV